MYGMSMPFESAGRVDQKRRTYDALVAAARDLVSQGVTPTVEGAAAAARVSRTTAYRYFPDQRALLVAAHPETGASSLLTADDSPEDVEARLAAVVARFTALIRDTEAQQRTMLRLSLETDNTEQASRSKPLPLRQGRAIAWISEALDPAADQLTDEQRHALTLAIRSAIGIEALVWLTDVGGLSREQAGELMAWSAQALLRGALLEEPPRPPKGTSAVLRRKGDTSPSA
jgi:AcrR family transcriptional regulator